MAHDLSQQVVHNSERGLAINPMRKVLANLRPDRTAHYVFMLIMGVLFSLSYGYVPAFGFTQAGKLSLAILVVIMAYQTACILNDFFDTRCDRITNPGRPLICGSWHRNYYRLYGIACFLLSVILAALVNYQFFTLILSCHAVSWLYSVPPFRLKRFSPVNILVIAVGSWFLLWAGYSIFAGKDTVQNFPASLTLWCFLILPLVISIKDLRDIEGDRVDGVTTVATFFGRRCAARLLAPAILLAFVLTPLLLQQINLWPLGLIFGIIAAIFLWWRPDNDRPLFLIYGIFTVILGWTILSDAPFMQVAIN